MNFNVDFKSLLIKSEGRINRADYWHALLETLISCVLFLLIFGAGLKLVQVAYLAISGNPLPFDAGFGYLLFLYAGWNFESLATITIKRLHDRNKSGWWIVPFIIAPSCSIDPRTGSTTRRWRFSSTPSGSASSYGALSNCV